jgi:hypothetical protein
MQIKDLSTKYKKISKEDVMKKQIFCIIFTVILALDIMTLAFAGMQSENYSIPTSVFSGGGIPTASTNYQADSTLAQPSPIMDSTNPPYSTHYDLYPGFWYTIEMVANVDVCEGDFNGDGDVDGSDLAVFAADFGRTDCSGDCEGDFDTDGDVDGSDLAVFAADFGRTDCP